MNHHFPPPILGRRPCLQAAPPEWEERKEPRGKLHPVLGELVADLKYKRVYLTSAEALIKAPVWQKANTLFPVRAMEIAEAKYLQEEVVSIEFYQICTRLV